ncbi:MAG: tRNA (N(6)-L-threonylcarbamoyladenosine(37)-C(2))-methylthiotransferase MtaB [Lachnoclostridium sp.]|nr:tRNA (N(6)-L-threonylcarbamoyladenosine(37)-C(2))-methylthiotransferase MtaB [Lachnospira sp.]MCM1249366.1 tRNA (N(6)-L-threonylcarbamoyladenosine(37)-C(2))-methylthiotransferase MtaB [Lachnoclostridium sp.]MCM1535286.1 tRNA (N(6)-L-threonylcarbamoyladenosine(37)-C(2))-methylthiotransferase MtaB [Clostridium sp.]
MKNVAFHNLGCKVNAYEWEVMQQKLQEKGYHIVPFDEAADIYIINTCTVTNIADRKSRQMLHRARQKNPEAVVVAVGCYVQTGKEAVEKDGSIDLAIGNNKKAEIVEILERYLKERQGKSDAQGRPDKTLGGSTVLDIARAKEYESMTLKRTIEHTRAYIKIQDGCNQFCSYCAIPYARGRVRSRRAEEVLEEVRGLAASGYKEVVLTGIHISSYGADFKKDSGEKCIDLIDLVEQIHKVEGIARIRLGSMEPRIVTEEAVARLAQLPKLCPHFHLSLQSGCDETLKRMNRHYTTEEYCQCVKLLRAAFEHPAITTDVIVGFPGETQEEFDCTRAFLERINFYEMHVFKYSRRKNTPADRMENQLTEKEKTLRSNELLDLEKRQSGEFRRYYIGKEAEVLLEEEKEIDGTRYFLGHTKDYVRVAVPADRGGLRPNMLLKVQVKEILMDDILKSFPY